MTARQFLPRLQAAARSVLRREKKVGQRLNILLVSAAQMRTWNKRYRQHDRPTDVLSFAAEEKKYLGEIVICPTFVRQSARRAGEKYERELLRLAVHGTLHLLGYDHTTRAAAAKMLPRQEKYLTQIKL